MLELAPNHAGTLRGLVNMFYHTAAFLAPVVAGYLTDQNVSEVLFAHAIFFGDECGF